MGWDYKKNSDPKFIWKSVNWKGTFDNSSFKQHFEQLLTQSTDMNENSIDLETTLYIPVLNDLFIPNEFQLFRSRHLKNVTNSIVFIFTNII